MPKRLAAVLVTLAVSGAILLPVGAPAVAEEFIPVTTTIPAEPRDCSTSAERIAEQRDYDEAAFRVALEMQVVRAEAAESRADEMQARVDRLNARVDRLKRKLRAARR